MDVKEAVRMARAYTAELFADDGIENVGLEEVVFDDEEKAWKVTLGFSRPWDRIEPGLAAELKRLSAGAPPTWKRRSFKVVQIDDDTGRVVSMTHRTLPATN